MDNTSELSATRKARFSLFLKMGGKCKICGFADFRALQIDHVKGDGCIDRKERLKLYKPLGGERREGFYRTVSKSIDNNENRFQLLCANCNWIKRVENREFGWHFSRPIMKRMQLKEPISNTLFINGT